MGFFFGFGEERLEMRLETDAGLCTAEEAGLPEVCGATFVYLLGVTRLDDLLAGLGDPGEPTSGLLGGESRGTVGSTGYPKATSRLALASLRGWVRALRPNASRWDADIAGAPSTSVRAGVDAAGSGSRSALRAVGIVCTERPKSFHFVDVASLGTACDFVAFASLVRGGGSLAEVRAALEEEGCAAPNWRRTGGIGLGFWEGNGASIAPLIKPFFDDDGLEALCETSSAGG
mmetsp:Transcript_38858/g.84590  ORF Transcript_38858/g.84590 Transcript_38858/m.84590 type:complete len:232 (+) Transcript_38858:871-1566(+)